MTKIFVLFLFLFNTLSAEQESFPFIGVTVSTQSVDLKPIIQGADGKPLADRPVSSSETTYGIQYGVQTQDYRTTFSAEGNSNFQMIDVEVDYILMDQMFGTPKLRPYVGATLGYVNYDSAVIKAYNEDRILDDKANDRNTSISTSDGYYGLDAGFLIYVTDDIDLDVSYHYYFMDRLRPLDTMSGATFSLHYFY